MKHLKGILLGLFVLWIFFVLGDFFRVQKPFSAANVVAFAGMVLNLLAAGWLAVLGLGLGAWLLDRLFARPLPLADTVVLGLGVGLGGLGLMGLAWGLIGGLRPGPAYLLTLLLTVLLFPQLRRLYRRWRPSARRSNRLGGLYSKITAYPKNAAQIYKMYANRWAGLYLAIVALYTIPVALLPPTDWDGLFYHLTGPKLYIEAGRIVGGVDIPHLSFPALMEMLYTWAMLLRGDIAAKLLHTGYGFLLAGLVYLVADRLLSRKAAWRSVLILLSMPMISTLAGWAYNDLALAFYQLAALYAILRYRAASQNAGPPLPWLLLGGILAGLAMGLKYTSFVAPLAVGLLLLGWAVRAPRYYLGRIVLFCLAAGLVALPWYAKNWAFTGNPVYPFLYDLFGGRYWDPFRAAWYAAAGTGTGFDLPTLLALPHLLTLGVYDANYWDGRTGPLLLLFLPLILWYILFPRRTERPAALGPLLFFALLQYGFWVMGVVWSGELWQSRLLLPGLAALAPVAGWVWSDLPRFDSRHFSLNRFVNITISLVLALTIIDMGLLTLRINPLFYLAGLESRPEYLARSLGGHYLAMERINEELPPEAAIQFLWEPRSYYCRRDCRPDSILDEFPHLVYQHHSAAGIARHWRQTGLTHVLIHRDGLEFERVEMPGAIDTEILAELEAEFLQPMFDIGGAYQLYAIKP